jgi:diaminopimelate decarboxylase
MNIARSVGRLSKQVVKRALQPWLGAPSTAGASIAPEIWGLQRTPSGALALDGQVLHDLGHQWGFPLHIVNATRLRQNADRFLQVPPASGSGCEVFYSYKTNPVPGVLSLIHARGIGAEVISHYELWLARQLGVPPERIVFNGPAKSRAAIREAVEAGIQLLNLNHREEIPVVSGVAQQVGRRVRVGIRVSVGQGWAAQFGVPLEGGQALAAYEEALRTPGLEVVGLHVHRGGMVRTREELQTFVQSVLAVVELLHQRLRLTLEVVNFGGSLGTPTVQPLSGKEVRLSRTFQRPPTPADPRAALSIEGYVAVLIAQVEEFFRTRGRPRPRVFIEPGRALTGDAQMLLASVLTLKEDARRTFAILDAGINLAESCRSEYHQLLSATHSDRGADRLYTVVGPICTPGDTLYWAAQMPALTPGDSVLIMDAGAYFVPFSTSFSFPQPAIVMIDDGRVTVLRRAEQFQDLVCSDRGPAGDGAGL